MTQGNVWNKYWIKDYFSFNCKTRLNVILTPEFEAVGWLWSAGSLSCHQASCRLFDLLFSSCVQHTKSCSRKKKQEHLLVFDMMQTHEISWCCVSLMMCTGPVFRWRPYTAVVLDLSKCCFFLSPHAFVKTATLQTNKLLILEMLLCSVSLSEYSPRQLIKQVATSLLN